MKIFFKRLLAKLVINKVENQESKILISKNAVSLNTFIPVIAALFAFSTHVFADVSGTVWQDLPVNGATLNTYGIKDSNELGVAGVTVTVYPAAATTTTVADGTWSIAGITGEIRVEFSNWPAYLKESTDAGGVNTSVQFVTAGSNVNFGLHDIDNYSNTNNPLYVNNVQANGSGVSNTGQSLHTLQYQDTGLNADYNDSQGIQGSADIPQDTVTIAQLGSVWGKAFQKDQQRLFVSSVLQRHVGFANSPASIFVLDYSSGVPSTLLGNYSLQGAAPANGGAAIDLGTVDRSSGPDNILADDPDTPNIDIDAFAKVGKISYGDIDFDQASNTLWLINLNQKGIISVDVSGNFASLSAATVNQYMIESLPSVPSCTGGSLRPWALKIHQGKGYLGAVCDALTSQNTSHLQAYVLSFDISNPAAGFTQELTFPLNYNKDGDDWHPWSDTDRKVGTNWKKYIQPILSDIEFDELNNMYVGFVDRYGLQAGFNNYAPIPGTTAIDEKTQSFGEIFKVCNTSGTYELEGTGSCPRTGSEFFNDKAGDGASEGSTGAMALLTGSNEILLSLVDPHPEGATGRTYWTTQGTNTLNTLDGTITNWYTNVYSGQDGFNGKASGMGDIELLTAAAPVEIGNFVWLDANANGIQDPGETPIAGVSVELLQGATVIANATTDTDGHYIFSNDPVPTSSTSHIYDITALKSNQAYIIRLPDAQGGSKQAILGTNILTTGNTGEGANPNINDSDGVLNGDNAEITVLASDIPSIGANNHSFDFGFKDSVTAISLDFGDAPNTDYPTELSSGGPRHTLSSSLYMGACVDDESDGQGSANADGDDNGAANANTNGTCASGDDEDSLTPPTLTDGQVNPGVNVTVNNTTGSDAFLACWVDYSGTGFDTGERSATVTVANGATTANVVLANVPATTSTDTGGSSFMRCRLASSAAEIANPAGAAANGEIEDYPITINAVTPSPVVSLDFGDAPSSDYPTTLAESGPRHTLDSDLFMGSCVDDEVNGQSSTNADGDDSGTANSNTNGSCATANDDEDSLTPPTLTDGQANPGITVTVKNTTSADAFLACWIDYSGSGFEAGERSATMTIVNNATSASITLPNVPATASTDTGGSSFMRCRLARSAAEIANPTGAAANGEIEDYPVIINASVPPGGGTPPPATPGTPVKPIPTLSEWGRIILIMLIGVIVMIQRGRRIKEDAEI